MASKTDAGLAAGLGLCLAASSLAARADEQAESVAADAADTAETSSTLDRVIVTASKLPRPALETYSSISVLTAEDLDAFGALDVRDALRLVPNAGYTPSERGNNGFTLRGINSEGVTGPANVTRPLASLVLDGVTQSFEGARRGTRGIYDVEQIEVVRGPQSTLLGRNALAGALLINTRDPTFDPEGSARVTVGTLGLREYAAAWGGPIGKADTAEHAIRVSAQSFASDKGYDIRTPLLESRIDEDDYKSARAKWLYQPTESSLTALFTASWTHDRPAQTGVQGPGYFDRSITVPLSSYEFRDATVGNYIADIKVDLRNDWELRSLTGFTRTDMGIETPAASALKRNEFRLDKDLTQELRLQTDRDNGFSAIVGLFAADLRNDRDSLVRLDPPGTTIQDLASETQLRNAAVFGELGIPLGDRFSATVGLRYEHEDYEVDFDDRRAGVRTLVDTSYSAFLPKFELAWAVTEHQRLALTASRGYRGGYVERRVSNGEQNVIDPEYLRALELAWRSELLERRLFLSVNLYHYDWRDQQVSIVDPEDPFGVFTITSNAASSTSKGVEFELRWDIDAHWRVLFGTGLLDTEFDDFTSASGDFSGFEFPEAPPMTNLLAVQWEGDAGWFAAGDVRRTDSYYSTARMGNRDDALFDQFLMNGYSVASIDAGYRTERWSARAFVRNVFDRDYLMGIAYNGNEGFVGDERSYGVTFDVTF